MKRKIRNSNSIEVKLKTIPLPFPLKKYIYVLELDHGKKDGNWLLNSARFVYELYVHQRN